MKFTLKDYQEEAVQKVLQCLQKARKRWHDDGDIHSFALAATTGAGKTVMAAAVFEALFHGNDEFDFEADPGAVVIWFSDDPSLNEQTRFRLQEASDRLTDLVVVDNKFSQPKLDAGKIYFLNTQKLGKKSLLVRGFDEEESKAQHGEILPGVRPDLRSHTIWDTIKNTIEDPELTLYLVLDEAHRGMGKPSNRAANEKTTIVKRLINGDAGVPPIPVVWGISATVERFSVAMKEAQANGRDSFSDVAVDPAKVQESGLLKDTIILDVPNEVGLFDTVLVRRATEKIKESSKAWLEYAEQQNDKKVVKPLMVLQVPNTPDHDEIGRALDTIYQHWPELPQESIAHVFGEHTKQRFGSHTIPYISPERVQDSSWVRVLIAKDAISTGWDCPRAEVMVSFRPAKDKTHITQLMGRMVRTPLARRIPGNDRLNSVDCLLPFFNVKAVESVADLLMGGGDVPPLPGRRVLVNPKEMTPNAALPESVWDKLLELPSQALPKRLAKPVKRLTALAHELAADELLPEAGKKAHAEMHIVLDAAQKRYAKKIVEARKDVLTVEGKSITADLNNHEKSFDDFLEDADFAVIEDAYRRASRIVSPDLARTYAEYLAENNDEADDPEEALVEAHADIAALGLVSEVKDYLEAEADDLAKRWLTEFRVPIKSLTDERQEVYSQLKAMSSDPVDIDLAKPKSWMEATAVKETDETETPLPTYAQHLMCDENGMFPSVLNDWEQRVLAAESGRSGFVAWYRNPSRPSQDSLGVTYIDHGSFKIMRPDFVFFSDNGEGSIAADIVDPHGIHLSDALPKLQGLAQYAEKHSDIYRRVEAVAAIGDTLRVLDMTDVDVRRAVMDATDAKELYEGRFADDY
jgi:hypothetical protein